MSRGVQAFSSILCLAFAASSAQAQSANDAVTAAFTKLSQVKSYRIKTTIAASGQYAQQMEMAKQMGMDMSKAMEQEVVNPDVRKVTMSIPIMPAAGMPSMKDMKNMRNMPNMPPMGGVPKMMQAKMYGISTSAGMASYLDCPECEKQMDESMRQQMEKAHEQMAKSLLQSALSPFGLISAGVQAAANAASEAEMKAAVPKTKEMMSLNRWTCRGGAPEKTDRTSPPNLQNLKATGTAKVGAEDAKTYQFTVTDSGSGREMPVTLYVSAASGLPLKFEASQPQGTMTMEYYDVNAPIDIPIPDCLKK